jgi:hypothetical protein
VDKNIVASKKANMGIIGVGAIVGTGILAVAAGAVTGPVAFPVVIDAIKWLVVAYLGAQGGQDAVAAYKGVGNGNAKAGCNGGDSSDGRENQ